ncbi:subtilisin-like protease SBT3.4 [Rutidosis leptorrhynchoides]|uniref:subtilisin-like protease SBT3.4 n=1 Tax=Rutidosis leptorrhynchoides TaxID=125765 RepID=UPI003A99D4D8
MGERKYDDPKLVEKTHHEMLNNVLGSEEASANSMIYSYKHSFSGFAAKLTKSQAKMFSEIPGVVRVIPNHFYRPQTTRSWDYLGLSLHPSSSGLLHQSNMGNASIIGVIDTGIWPESEGFNDRGLGPIPATWKGFCEPGENFTAKNCNRKLIGARYFIKGMLAEYGKPYNATEYKDFLSARETHGHGTRSSSIAAASFVANASYNGLGIGTLRGGAPCARVSMYKVCWRLYRGGMCTSADLLKAFDEATRDGVDVISVSLASDFPFSSEVNQDDVMSVGSFHAVAVGIPVICAAGNVGPKDQTVQNTPPWIITVAASTVDRSFPTTIMLGDNQTIVGESMFGMGNAVFGKLVFPEVSELLPARTCDTLTRDDTWAEGKIVLCFVSQYGDTYIEDVADSLVEVGCLGVIAAGDPGNGNYEYDCPPHFPCIHVSYDTGTQILEYSRFSSRDAEVRIYPSRTHIGKPVSTKVAYFSSRGPNSYAPEILKPDIAAPGVNILTINSHVEFNSKFAFDSGTSSATPHVAGIVALLKSLRPEWSPAAIKSAITTTAHIKSPSGEPIRAHGMPTKLADPFDFGGGIINPNRAADPGLVYDMNMTDYVNYLCSAGHQSIISYLNLTHPRHCNVKRPSSSILDMNLPSITVPNLRRSVNIKRTVTNVGATDGKYKAVVESPSGTNVHVKPNVLVFNSSITSLTFTVVISSTQSFNMGYSFGSLTWTFGVYAVRIPISVRTSIPEMVILPKLSNSKNCVNGESASPPPSIKYFPMHVIRSKAHGQ